MSEYRDAIDRLDALYAELPVLECEGKCAHSCGPVPMSKFEDFRLRRKLKVESLPSPKPPAMACPLLASGRCTVYKARPLVCRLWGLVDSMPCPHGCVPDRYLTHGEGKVFLLLAQLISAESDEERVIIREQIGWIQNHPDEMEEEGKAMRLIFAEDAARERALALVPSWENL